MSQSVAETGPNPRWHWSCTLPLVPLSIALCREEWVACFGDTTAFAENAMKKLLSDVGKAEQLSLRVSASRRCAVWIRSFRAKPLDPLSADTQPIDG
jgi:hypothetical protein